MYTYDYMYESILLLLIDFKGMTLNTMFETLSSYWILMRTFVFCRLWLEDKQLLALAGSTGSVLILKKGYLVFGKKLLIENMC